MTATADFRHAVAITGMACRFPGADDVGQLWQLLLDGRDAFGPVPAQRWRVSDFYDPEAKDPDRAYSDVGAFLDDIEHFPGVHFGMPPRRVEVMDPQQRLLLEAVRVALEDAALDGAPVGRNVGVYVGVSTTDYKDRVGAKLRSRALASGAYGRVPPADLSDLACDVPAVRPFTMPGLLLNMTAATISQTFDFSGPSIAIDSACASSLAALHQAVTAIRAGQCDAAVVGGVHLNLSPDSLVGFSRIGAVSRAGRCRPFDREADGFVLGEGVGVVILQPLADVRPGQRVYAVIRGVGSSNDGKGAGPMAPRREGQELALRRAYADAGIDPATVRVVEAHGTGTAVGDVVEMAALRSVVDTEARDSVCYVSSIKGNIGHSMSAASIAGLIKAALVVSNGVVPPQAGFVEANPKLGLDRGGLTVPVQAHPLGSQAPVRAGVSSFGFGGTNVHAVLEGLPAPSTPESVREQPELVVLSAPTRDLLARYAGAVARAVADEPARSVAAVAAELAGRAAGAHVLALVATTRDDLLLHLTAAADQLTGTGDAFLRLGDSGFAGVRPDGVRPRIAFLCPGQGAQQVDALGDLYQRFPVFRDTLQSLDEAARAAGGGFLDALYPAAGTHPVSAAQRLTATQVCQPALATLSLAHAALLAQAGVVPDVALGHSLGEFAAAGAVGLLPASEVTALTTRRGAVMGEAGVGSGGAMLAVRTTAAELRPHLSGLADVWIANENEPRQVVATGSADGIEQLRRRLGAAGVQCRLLPVSHAFHSPLMAPAATRLEPLFAALEPAGHPERLISCITGKPYEDVDELRRTWQQHTTSPVRFEAAVRTAAQHADIFVQLGPGRSLLQMANATLGPDGPHRLVAGASDTPDGGRGLLLAAAQLLALGVDVQPRALVTGTRAGLPLPASPVPMERYALIGSRRTDSSADSSADSAADSSAAPAADSSADTNAATPTGRSADRVAATRPAPSSPDPQETAMDHIVALFREQAAVLQAIATGSPVPALSERLTAAVAAPLTTAPTPAAPLTTAPTPAAPLTTAPVSAAPLAAAPAAAPPADVLAVVTDVLADVSAFPRDVLRPEQGLVTDLGFDSLMFTDVLARLHQRWPALDKTALAAALTTESSVADLAQLVAAAIGATGAVAEPAPAPRPEPVVAMVPAPVQAEYRIEDFPEYRALQDRLGIADAVQLRNPYFTVHEGIIGATTRIEGREVLSYSNYNYLGLSGDPAVTAAAKDALDQYGTSVSASRLLSGDKPLHRELEHAIRDLLHTEDALVLVSGHATNVTVIGHLVGPDDVILHDALAHDSILQGCKLSGAARRPFKHNDPAELDRMLTTMRDKYRRAIVIVEGVYSMDGDIADLPRFIEVAHRHRALLMVDEAHSIGVLGATGGGVREHFGLAASDVDIWMGTLSKSLSSCGGYIAGSAALIQYLKYTLPGFIYSCGLPPASAAASLAAIRVMQAEPERLRRLHANARLFKRLADEAGLPTGLADGTAVIPIIAGESLPCLQLANVLLDRGIHVNPILYPAVEEGSARLRFFLTAAHSEEQIRHTVEVLAEEFGRIVLPADKAA